MESELSGDNSDFYFQAFAVPPTGETYCILVYVL